MTLTPKHTESSLRTCVSSLNAFPLFIDHFWTLFCQVAKSKLLCIQGSGREKLLLGCFKQRGEDQYVSLTPERQPDWVTHYVTCSFNFWQLRHRGKRQSDGRLCLPPWRCVHTSHVTPLLAIYLHVAKCSAAANVVKSHWQINFKRRGFHDACLIDSLILLFYFYLFCFSGSRKQEGTQVVLFQHGRVSCQYR